METRTPETTEKKRANGVVASTTDGSESDRDLAQLSAEQAIPALLERHGGKLFGMSLRLCGSREDAEELLQDIFLTAFQKWGQFEGRSEPTTWLYTIASRACQRKQRRRAGEPKTFDSLDSIEDFVPKDEASVPVLAAETTDPSADPFEATFQSELREQIEKALESVPKDFRMALVLKDIAELSLAEVAAVLGIKEATAKTRVYRARLAMRKALADAMPQRPVRDPDAPPICRDLLFAKLEALDRGVEFELAPELLSDRCETFFQTLDLTRESCRLLGAGGVPVDVRQRLERVIETEETNGGA